MIYLTSLAEITITLDLDELTVNLFEQHPIFNFFNSLLIIL